MTEPQDPTRESMDTPPSRVINAAERAWRLHNEPLHLARERIDEHGWIDCLTALEARRVEYVVEGDEPSIWETLADLNLPDYWQPCALVPLPLMGRAHETLSESRFELQSWWLEGERVEFGSIEIA